jgi:hypothetical protein
LRERLLRLGLRGLLADVEIIMHEPWLPQLLQIEDSGILHDLGTPSKADRSPSMNHSAVVEGCYGRSIAR